MMTLAGFVPWAVSGMMMRLRVAPLRLVVGAHDSRPVSSPWAPAAGCSVVASMPAISASQLLELVHELESPLDERLRLVGMQAGEALEAATTSLTLGLYFIVQEPSG